MSELLEVRRITRAFDRVKAVDKVSFSVGAGEIYGFIGPNGAGKTTTMRILATLDLPDSGDARIEGVSILERPRAVRRRIGFMSDAFTAYAHLNVHEYLDFFARACGLSGKARIDTVRSIASFCQLTEFHSRPVSGMSKGMSQRLHLAKTLLHDPKLLILDEPASGLDPRARIEFRDLLRELAAAGKSVLISSHILAELSETCHGVIVIERGKVVTSGSIEGVAAELENHNRVRVKYFGEVEPMRRFFLAQPHVDSAEPADEALIVHFTGDEEQLAELLTRATAAGLKIHDFHVLTADLEQIFMRSTSGRLQ